MSIFDEVLAMKKTAGPLEAAEAGAKSFGGHFGKALLTGVGAGAAGAAISGAGVAASKIYDAITKAHDFRNMMESSFNADLHDHYQQKPKLFNEAFSSLRTFNPAFTKDPMVAGTYMRRMMSFQPENAGGVLLESLGHRKDVGESGILDSFQRAGTSAAGGAMSEFMKPKKTGLMSPEEEKQHLRLEESKAEIQAKYRSQNKAQHSPPTGGDSPSRGGGRTQFGDTIPGMTPNP